MVHPLLLQYYQLLPEYRAEKDPAGWARSFRKGLGKFKRAVVARYNEATLERLLHATNPEVRQAAVLALGIVGTIKVNPSLAARLHDDDPTVCQLATDAMWSIWFRADGAEHNAELARLAGLTLGAIVSISDAPASPYFGPYGFYGTFGPDRFCGTVRSPVFRRGADGKRRRVGTRTRRVCRVPPIVTSSVTVTFAVT